MNFNYGMQDYLAEINCYTKSTGTNSRDISSLLYSDSQLMQADSIISQVKNRSKSAKKPKMGLGVEPSLQEFLDSVPVAKYLSKRSI